MTVVVLVGFAGMRSYVGTDYSMYMRLYTGLVPGLPWAPQVANSQQEFGYSYVSLWLRSWTQSPHAIFWVASVLTVVPSYIAIKRMSRDPGLSVLLYVLLAFYVGPFNIVRQGIALAFNLLALSYLGRNRVLFCLFNVIATLFHTTALIATILQLIVYKWKPSVKSMIALLAVVTAAAGVLFAVPQVSDVVSLFSERYARYIATGTAAGFGTYLLIAAQVLLLILAFILARVTDERTGLNMVVVSVAFLILGSQLAVASRMQLYFGIILVVLLPNQLSKAPAWGSAVKIGLVLGATVYYIFYLNNYGDLLPYRSYLDDPGGV